MLTENMAAAWFLHEENVSLSLSIDGTMPVITILGEWDRVYHHVSVLLVGADIPSAKGVTVPKVS